MKCNCENKVNLIFEGKRYSKVNRKAKSGDVVIVNSMSKLSSFIKTNTPYKVVENYKGKTFLNRDYLASVYHEYYGRNENTVDVYAECCERKLQEENLEEFNEIIIYEGDKYKKVNRKAYRGDVIVVRSMIYESTYVEIDKMYKVFCDYQEIPYMDRDYLVTVYHEGFGRTENTVDVYGWIDND